MLALLARNDSNHSVHYGGHKCPLYGNTFLTNQKAKSTFMMNVSCNTSLTANFIHLKLLSKLPFQGNLKSSKVFQMIESSLTSN